MLIRLLKKIRAYKNALVIVFALNLFFLSLGVLVTWNYASVYGEQKAQLKKSLVRQSAAIQLLSVDAKNLTFENQFVALRNASVLGYNLQDIQKGDQRAFAAHIGLWKEKAILDLEEIALDLESLSHQLDQIRSEILWSASLAVLFGLFLPGIFFYLISKASLHAKKLAEDKVKLWVHDWHQSKNSYEDPFKSPQFWVNIALLTSGHFLTEAESPYLNYVGKISGEIRAELKKSEGVNNQKAS